MPTRAGSTPRSRSRSRPCCRPSRRPIPNPLPTGFNIAALNAPRVEEWFDNALRGPDQLRQRVAWALSQIMVVSQVGALQNLPFATADFHDMLARDALRRLPQAARGRDAAPGDGHLPLDARQPEGRRRHQPAPRRELRSRGHAADVDRPGRAEPRRHAQARRGRPADPDLHPGDHRGLRARVHRLALGLPDDDADLHLRQRTHRSWCRCPATTRSSRCSSTRSSTRPARSACWRIRPSTCRARSSPPGRPVPRTCRTRSTTSSTTRTSAPSSRSS